jgi:hypothetical protein
VKLQSDDFFGPASRSRRGAAALLGVLFLGLAGVAMIVLAALMPVGARAVDPSVLAAAGKGTPSFQGAGRAWMTAEKPGTAALFVRAEERLTGTAAHPLIAPGVADEAAVALWGGHDPFLEQIFSRQAPAAQVDHPPVIPLFIPRESRQQLRSFLTNARNPAVRVVMENRRVEETGRFMPVGAAAGQPLEATLYLTALLLQGNHFSPGLAEEIRGMAERANTENRLGELETVYLDIFALGTRLQWQPMVDLLPLLPDRHALRRTAHLCQVLEEDWMVFGAAAIWSRNPADLSRLLVDRGRAGLDDLRQALLAGQGAVHLLVRRQEPVQGSVWRSSLPEMPVVLASLALTSPELVTTLKVMFLVGGTLAFFLALNLAPQVLARGRILGRPFSFTLMQSGLLATALALTLLVFNEPLLAETGQKSEFRIALPISIASTAAEIITEKGLNLNMDQITLIALTVFFALQLIVYALCWIKVMEIRRQPIASNLKLRLLENEDNLFDCGLYVGLAGTVSALIFLAIGIIDGALMAAYASTLFGIVFVALFKICHLRPYRRRLILESQTYSG